MEKIAKELRSNGKDCKIAWRSLRDQFIRCRKEYKGKTGQAAEETKKYKLFERLFFLSESLEPKANYELDKISSESMADYEESNVNYEDLVEFDECSGYLEPTVLFEFEAAPSQTSKTEPLQKPPLPTLTTSTTSTPKRKMQDDVAENFKEFLNTLPAQIATKEADGVDMFFSSVSETVKGYNLSQSNLALLQRVVIVFVTENLENFRKSNV